jgi:hypothetical protein
MLFKPIESGSGGQYWENIGWKVLAGFTRLAQIVRPKDHIAILRPLLPQKYSPLTQDGNGLQSIDDAHDGTLQQADAWLRNNIAAEQQGLSTEWNSDSGVR